MDSAPLLKSKRFLPYFVTQFTGAFNDSLIRRAVEMLIAFKGLSGALPAETAIFLLLGLFMLPFFTFSAWAGFLADTINKEKLIRVIKGFEIGIVLLAGAGLISHNIYLSATAVLALGIHSSFFGPVKFSLPPQHLETSELIAANGLIEAGTNIAILAGTILGSIAVMLPHGEWLVTLLGFSVALGGFVASSLVPAAPPSNGAPAQRDSTLGLLRRLYRDKALWRITMGISWFWTLGAILISLFSLIVKDILRGPEITVSVFFGIFSIGVGLGSVLCNRLLKGLIEATWVPLASLIMAVSIFAFYALLQFSAGPTIPPPTGVLEFFLTVRGLAISLSLFTLSLAAGIFIVPLYGLLQHRTLEEERSRLVAANNVLNAFLMVIGSLGLAAAVQLGLSIGSVLLILASLNVLVAIYTCLLLPEELLKGLLRAMFMSLFRARVSGLDLLQTVGPKALIVANHLSFLDAVMLAAFLPGRATFAVNTGIAERWWMKPVIWAMDAIPIDPANPLAVRVLIDRLKENRQVVIFPEGRITITGTLMKVYEGPALISEKADAPIVPIRLEGFQYTIFSRARNLLSWRLFPKLSMTVCPPTRLSVDSAAKGKQRRELLGLKLHDLMTEMLFQTNERGPTLLHALERASRRYGKRKIIASDPISGKISYGQLLQRSFILSKSLPSGYGDSAPLGVFLPNGLPLLTLLFAAHWRRLVPALLNFSHSPEQIEATCKVARLSTVVTSRRFIELGKLEEPLARITALGIRTIFLEDIRANLSALTKFSRMLQYQGARLMTMLGGRALFGGKRDEAAVVLFTSGSEGTPKGVVLSHDNLLSNVDQVTATVPVLPSDKVFNALPMFHSFGLTGATLMPLLKGTPVVLYPSPLHYKIIPEIVYNEAATILFGTPTFLAGYAKKAHPYDFFSVRYIFSGAERLPDSVRTLYHERFGIRIFEGYGATEAAPVIAVNTPFHSKKGSVGRLLPGIGYQLSEVPGIADAGRLMVKGPNIMRGYLRIENPGVLEPLKDEWYDTGDIVSIDEFGFVTIKGRAKRFAKIAGEMVSLTAVEQALEAVWPNAQHAVVAQSDEKKGERLILVTTRAGTTREELLKELSSRGLPELAIPRIIEVRESLPLLGSGKIDVQGVLKSLSKT